MTPRPPKKKGIVQLNEPYTRYAGPASDTASTTASSGNWSGVVDLAAVQYTSVSAHWTVPTVTGATVSYMSIWVGMDGWNSLTVEQVGIFAYDNGTTTSWFPWVEYFPDEEEWWNTTAYPILAGDAMSASLTYAAGTGTFSGSNYFTATLTNSTSPRIWTYAAQKTEQAAEFEGGQTSAYARNSAQVIVESNSGSLCDYGTINFTSISAAPDNFGTATYVTMINGSTDSTPGQSSGAPTGGNLTMTWHAYN